MLYGSLGDLMKYNAFGGLRVYAQDFAEMPGNSLAFAVFIRCEPDLFG